MEGIDIYDRKSGLMTLGLSPELIEVCRNAHEEFLLVHHLNYWKLTLVQIPGTLYILISAVP